ncbi:MAG: acyl-CoA thioesterase [Hyphomonadaceae bacterium]|nr:acyl-CoA thioesterase [Hyphomonadaceae bacterium]
MNLFLRIVLVWIKALFRRRIGILEAFESDFTVWWTDQDALRHVTNSRFFSLTDVCVIDYFLRARVWKALQRNGWFPLIVYEDMHFHKPLRYPSKFRVRTQFLGWDEERIIASHRFMRGETLIAAGYTVARFVDKKGKAVPVSVVAAALKAPVPPPLPAEAGAVMERSRGAAAASLAASSVSGAAEKLVL